MQQQQKRQQENARGEQAPRSSKLDDRYGKIGIPAVAAAVHCRGVNRKSDRPRDLPQDCD
jgi:hypothetical protein